MSKTPRSQSTAWRHCRRCLRACRVGLLFLVFLVIAGGVYFNQVGLPEFLKRPLLDKLRARGVDLQFTRLRLRYYRGLVAEDVRFGKADAPAGSPSLSAREVELRLNPAALLHFSLSVDSVVLNQGRFIWPVPETNRAPRRLSVNDIQSQIRLLPGDRWELDHLTAHFAGAKFVLVGAITNASALRDWKIFRAKTDLSHPGRLQERLRKVADALEQIRFSDNPELKLMVRGDARDPQSFSCLLTIQAAGAETPWGTFANGQLVARLLRPDATNHLPHADFVLHADSAQTPWGRTKQLHLDVRATSDETETNLARCRMELRAGEIATEWAAGTNAQIQAEWSHSLTNAIPVAGHGEAQLYDARARWGAADVARVEARIDTPGGATPTPVDPGWGWWTNLAPYLLDWNCRLKDARARGIEADEADCAGTWRAPELTVTNLHAKLYQGQLNFQAGLNVATRKATFDGASDFDAHKLAPVLTPHARHWLDQYSWDMPPALRGSGEFVLPAWTNRAPDWRGEVLPTLRLQAELHSGPAAFRGVPVLSADSHILFSNQVWHLPDLVAKRPEGKLYLEHIGNDETHEFYFHVRSGIDLKPLRRLLQPRQQQVFDWLVLEQPPQIEATIHGHGWHDYDKIGFQARVETTNFTFRGEPANRLRADVQYTNRVLQVTRARVDRGTNFAAADLVAADFNSQLLWLSNGFSTIEPMSIARAIGPKIARHIEPYKFLNPPVARVNGRIPLDAGDNRADLHFNLDGGPFQWSKFNLDHIAGGLHWVGNHLSLSSVQADFYGGRLTGSALFEFSPDPGTDFSFDTIVTGASIGALMSDIYSRSNTLEGTLNGHLKIDHANSADWNSWQGAGQADLHDGLIWAIPIFGVFSEPLDALWPGLGKSRASDGSATFTITNSVIRTTDLELRAPAMRLQYRGTVDFQGRTDAVVEAKVLRDFWMIGPVLSKVLWPVTKAFEYKVTGTLANPKPEPVFLPTRILMIPFHPFRALKEIFPGDSNSSPHPVEPPNPKD